MPCLRVLHAYKVFKPDVDGGIPEVIATLTEQAPPDVQSDILVSRPAGFARKFSWNLVPVTASASLGTAYSIPLSPAYPFNFVAMARRSDLIVHHAPFPLTDLCCVFVPKSRPLIVHWHAEIVGRQFAKAALSPAIRHSLRSAQRIIISHPANIANSEFLKDFEKKCTSIPYGVDIRYWESLTQLQAERVALLKERFPRLIVAVGRLVAYKGHAVLLEALSKIDAHLVLVGEGPLLNELRSLAARLGAAGKVTFAGRIERDEIKQLFHAATVTALPSISSAEAFGLVQIEAMATGCPVVNTSLPTAVPHIARHELEGLTARPNDPGALSEALQRILNSQDLRARFGQCAKLRARSQFSLDLFRSRIFRVYREVMTQQTAPLA